MACKSAGLKRRADKPTVQPLVVFATANRRYQNRRTVSGALAANQQPVLAVDCGGAHGTLGEVVVETQIAVLHVTIQC